MYEQSAQRKRVLNLKPTECWSNTLPLRYPHAQFSVFFAWSESVLSMSPSSVSYIIFISQLKIFNAVVDKWTELAVKSNSNSVERLHNQQ